MTRNPALAGGLDGSGAVGQKDTSGNFCRWGTRFNGRSAAKSASHQKKSYSLAPVHVGPNCLCLRWGDGSFSSGGTSGHSWIAYTPDGGTATTYGTWGNNPNGLGNGLHSNLEAGRTGDATRSAHLNDKEEASLYSVIYGTALKGENGWRYSSPCSTFSSETWNRVAGESLSPYGPYSNPSSSMNSIINANGGVFHGRR